MKNSLRRTLLEIVAIALALSGPAWLGAAQLYQHGDPTAEEQYMLELVNRARANPAAEAARLKIGLNDGLNPGTISTDAKPPLGFHERLIASARLHSLWMLDNDEFDHIGAGGSNPYDRMVQAAYPFSGRWAAGENIAYRSSSEPLPPTTFTQDNHDGLFRSPAHRVNLMESLFDEIGIGLPFGLFTQGALTLNTEMATQNFASSGGTPGPLLLGVVYQDRNGDQFYTPGEGLSGVTVQPASGQYYAVTSTSGGYAIPLVGADTSLPVTFSGGALTTPITKTITLTSINQKLDLDLSRDKPSVVRLGQVRRRPDGVVELDIVVSPVRAVTLQASADLKQWQAVLSATPTAESTTLTDVTATGKASRFYRLTY